MTFLLLAFVVVSCQAQSPAFEAASVKLNLSGGDRGAISLLPGRVTVRNMTLKGLVRYAWDVRDLQISGGPAWMDSDRWDIAATAGREITEDERKRMLQTLLLDRFKMTIRRDTKELAVYTLVVGKNGPKLEPNTDGRRSRFSREASEKGLARLVGDDVPVERIAVVLVGEVGRNVIDRTGLQGNFDFKLEWVPDPANMPMINGAKPDGSKLDGASIFTAVQEQLGLKLESAKGPVEMLAIERAEKATEN